MYLGLLITNALISLLCTACSGPGLLEHARPPHYAAHGRINRAADAARTTTGLPCLCDRTKEALEAGEKKKAAPQAYSSVWTTQVLPDMAENCS